ncbi:TPA: hypothetical protein I9Z65_000169 [Clostridium perfringens]|uniref:hypothetical protein n=1 Tax=Clostridium perfringens TaxID=1502 RepID=UPI001B815EEC|nr:hypothetical protein [Clostridium perfringens]MDH2475961.1 hypothetical protein [Clostridium perfringens]HBC2028664.1 hypothetical protein [Clostridium perfringens]HBC2031995.1 hypothetical protein [Clostridium perfringens]HBC2055730.1 hypothetical protein [Clostridium perfringens]HBC2069346.1 hypothetical protein [Clostridium perfringens]
MCSFLTVFFDNKVTLSELKNIDVFEILECYLWIKLFVNEIIINRISDIFCEKVEYEGSAFDEYDEVEGVSDKELDQCKNYEENQIEILNSIVNYSIRKYRDSLNTVLDMDLLELLDYIESDINKDVEGEEYY